MSKKPGKTPVSAKQGLSDIELLGSEQSMHDIPKDVIDAMEAKGLTLRWLNAKTYLAGGNLHRSGWRALKSNEIPTDVLNKTNISINGDGLIIRFDSLLGCKPTEQQVQHRRKLRARANIMAGVDDHRAKDLQEALGGPNEFVKILDGYEKNN